MESIEIGKVSSLAIGGETSLEIIQHNKVNHIENYACIPFQDTNSLHAGEDGIIYISKSEIDDCNIISSVKDWPELDKEKLVSESDSPLICADDNFLSIEVNKNYCELAETEISRPTENYLECVSEMHSIVISDQDIPILVIADCKVEDDESLLDQLVLAKMEIARPTENYPEYVSEAHSIVISDQEEPILLITDCKVQDDKLTFDQLVLAKTEISRPTENYPESVSEAHSIVVSDLEEPILLITDCKVQDDEPTFDQLVLAKTEIARPTENYPECVSEELYIIPSDQDTHNLVFGESKVQDYKSAYNQVVLDKMEIARPIEKYSKCVSEAHSIVISDQEEPILLITTDCKVQDDKSAYDQVVLDKMEIARPIEKYSKCVSILSDQEQPNLVIGELKVQDDKPAYDPVVLDKMEIVRPNKTYSKYVSEAHFTVISDQKEPVLVIADCKVQDDDAVFGQLVLYTDQNSDIINIEDEIPNVFKKNLNASKMIISTSELVSSETESTLNEPTIISGLSLGLDSEKDSILEIDEAGIRNTQKLEDDLISLNKGNYMSRLTTLSRNNLFIDDSLDINSCILKTIGASDNKSNLFNQSLCIIDHTNIIDLPENILPINLLFEMSSDIKMGNLSKSSVEVDFYNLNIGDFSANNPAAKTPQTPLLQSEVSTTTTIMEICSESLNKFDKTLVKERIASESNSEKRTDSFILENANDNFVSNQGILNTRDLINPENHESLFEIVGTNIGFAKNIKDKYPENETEFITHVGTENSLINKSPVQVNKDTENASPTGKESLISGKNSKKDIWKCADPACNTRNKDSKICRKCNLPNTFIYESFRIAGKKVTKIKNMDCSKEEKYIVVHHNLDTVYVRSSRLQKDFEKFSHSLNLFVQDMQKEYKHITLSISEVGGTYIFISENIPYRVTLDKAIPECSTDGTNFDWLVNFKDVGNSKIVTARDLIKLPQRCHFDVQRPLVNKYFMNNVHFLKVKDDAEKFQICSWIEEQLLNKTVSLTFRNMNIKYKGSKTYADIFLDDGQHFNSKLAEKFPIFAEEIEKYSCQVKYPNKKSGGSRQDQGVAPARESSFLPPNFDIYPPTSREFNQCNNPANSHKDNSRDFNRCSYESSGSFWNDPFASNTSFCDGNRLANSSMVAAPAYNSNSFSNYSSIPPPPSLNFAIHSSALASEEKNVLERKNAILEGKLKAYMKELERQHSGSLAEKLKQLYNNMCEIMNKRKETEPIVETTSPLCSAVILLMNDRQFNSNFDLAISFGKDIRDEHNQSKVNISSIYKFQDACQPLKVIKKLEEFNNLISVLEELNAKRKCSLGDNQDSRSSRYSEKSYADCCAELNETRSTYFKNKLKTDEAVTKICNSLQSYTTSLRSLIEGNETKEPAISGVLDRKDLWEELTIERELFRKYDVPKSFYAYIDSILEEVKNRRNKILDLIKEKNFVQSISAEWVLQDSDMTDILPAVKKDEQKLCTLLNFVRTSQKVSRSFKTTILGDIFKELLVSHMEGKAYVYVNPANILIDSGATLCSQANVSLSEPIPPFRFIAPECQTLQPSYKSNYADDSRIGLSADCFSLGQLIRWIYCLDSSSDEFLELMVSVVESHPLLKKMLDSSPSQRPSLEELEDQNQFSTLLKNVFGDCDVPDFEDQNEVDLSDMLSSVSIQQTVNSSAGAENKLVLDSEPNLIAGCVSVSSDPCDITEGASLRKSSDVSQSSCKIDMVKNDEDAILRELYEAGNSDKPIIEEEADVSKNSL